MTDREKVIKGLEECLSASCRGFKPGIYCPVPDETWDYIRDALVLLKAQEPTDGDTISRSALLAAYDAAHKGPPGGARKLIVEAPAVTLKEQEPRVMTSSEVMDYVGYCEKNPPRTATTLPLWTESKKETGVFSGYRTVENIRNLINMSGLDRTYIFNQHWRCWTARPTEVQREAVKWK